MKYKLTLKTEIMKTIAIILAILIGSHLFAQKLEPTQLEALLKIHVSDFGNKPRINDIIILKATKTSKEYQCVTDNNGYSELLVPKGDTYLISYKSISKEEKYNSLIIPQLSGMITSTLIIKYEPAKTITLENVYFDFNKSTLKPTSFESLNELADFMKIKTTLVIEISGHTDDVGDETYNKVLSQARAESVRDYLIKKGIAADRLIAKGYGDEQPIAGNDDDEGRQKNRRTEIRIISE
jgi:outer membrane protein OmpA-like peptidoglycan-associated protein